MISLIVISGKLVSPLLTKLKNTFPVSSQVF